jgi:predicted RNA-binding protein with EMAP domain
MTETHTHTANPFSFDRGEFAALGKKRLETFVHVQNELLEEIQEVNWRWLDRIQSEANLVAEYASQLSSARTIPDAMAVSRDWSAQYLQRLADDGKHFADDTRKFIETGARLFSHGFETPAATA